MTPLLRGNAHAQSTLKLFKMLRARYPEETAGPFLAMKGKFYEHARTKVMLVGKATNAEMRDTRNARRVQEFRQRMGTLTTNLPDSPYWRFLALVLHELKVIASDDTDSAQEHAVWSNVLKVGAKRGNPTGDLLRQQSAHAREALEAEIAEANPDVIILTTANLYFDVWSSVLMKKVEVDEREWTPIAAAARYGVAPSAAWYRRVGSRHLFWCMHPERKPKGWRESVAKFIASKVQDK